MNLEDLKKHKQVLVIYLRSKLEQEDWHGVADAAMDLREICARIDITLDMSLDKSPTESDYKVPYHNQDAQNSANKVWRDSDGRIR